MSAHNPKVKRDAAATKERILKAGIVEFGAKGYGGARTEEIAKRAKCNIRMLYHYYGGKQDLYLACLDRVYSRIRNEERQLELDQLEPVEAIRRLVQFTFDHMRDNQDFVELAGIENTQRAKFIKRIQPVANAALDLIKTIDAILKRGARQKVLRRGIDPFQLYISILSLSYMHLSNRYTLGATYGRDLTSADWLDERREHVTDLILSYVKRSD